MLIHTILVTFGQGHWITLAFGIHRGAWSTFFHITEDNCFGKIHCFTFLSSKSPWVQIWPRRKIGQGQPKVTIWTNLVILSHLILHTKFQGNQPSGSEEEWFFKVFTIYGHCGHLGQWDLDHLNKFSIYHCQDAVYEIWLKLAQWFQRSCHLKKSTTPTTDDR